MKIVRLIDTHVRYVKLTFSKTWQDSPNDAPKRNEIVNMLDSMSSLLVVERG